MHLFSTKGHLQKVCNLLRNKEREIMPKNPESTYIKRLSWDPLIRLYLEHILLLYDLLFVPGFCVLGKEVCFSKKPSWQITPYNISKK